MGHGGPGWSVRFAAAKRAAHERAKEQLRSRVEQKQLRAAEAEAEAKLRSAEIKNEKIPQKEKRKRSRAGRPKVHDWEDAELLFWKLMDERGDFRRPENQTDKWNSKRKVASAVREYMEKHSDSPPEEKTIERRINRWLKSAARVGRN
jgi:hypothetical protein